MSVSPNSEDLDFLSDNPIPSSDILSPIIEENSLEEGKTPIENENPIITLNKIRFKNKDRVIFGQLNINSIRFKHEALKPLLQDNVDICLITETKIDDSFPPINLLLMVSIPL